MSLDVARDDHTADSVCIGIQISLVLSHLTIITPHTER